MLADLMPELQDSAAVQQAVDGAARELERLEETARDIRSKLSPLNADDTYNTLKMWERLFGLPVAPPIPVEQRRALVLASLRKRKSAAGSDWVELLTLALGGTSWEHQEGPTDYLISIKIPYDPTGFTAGQVAAIARRITPAHLDIATGLIDGFLIGISLIGDTL